MSSSDLTGYDQFQNGEIPDSIYFSEEGELKQVEFPASVWERARKIFSQNTEPQAIIDFIKSDNASKMIRD